jgi:glycosyltransferase involved in cell wall biosynthesis
MKIVQLLPSLDVGGMERLVIAMARQQKEEGHEPLIYCSVRPGVMARDVEALGIPVIDFAKRPGFSLSLVCEIARRMRLDRPDVVHTHNALVHHYGVLAGKLARVPVVLNTRHGYANFSWDATRERIFNAMSGWTDAIVMVTEGVQEYFVTQQRIPRARTRVILNGADIEPFLARQASPGSRRPLIRFGTVGRLSAPKNHTLLVRAFHQVLQVIPQAELHIMGEGECRAEIESTIAELGLAGRVRLHGYSADVPDFLQTLDLFVLSSSSEGLPLAVIEAMASGLPVVSTRMPGVENVAPEGRVGWYCPPRDASALASIMTHAGLHDNLASIGGDARTLARQFSTANMWLEYEQLYLGLLQSKGAILPPRGRSAA